MLKPSVDGAMQRAAQSRFHSAATIMSADDDVPDGQNFHSILHHGHAIRIVRRHDVGHIAVDEQFPWRQTDDFVRRNAAVGTTDPQVIRCLDVAQTIEKMRIASGLPGRPFAVVGEQIVETRHTSMVAFPRNASGIARVRSMVERLVSRHQVFLTFSTRSNIAWLHRKPGSETPRVRSITRFCPVLTINGSDYAVNKETGPCEANTKNDFKVAVRVSGAISYSVA
jgi:hypothetical protein